MRNNVVRSLLKAFAVAVTAAALSACAFDQTGGRASSPAAVSDVSPCCGAVTPAARRVLGVLDASDVEHLWAKRRHVNWETGVPDRPADYKGHEAATHCSAFAAAMGERLGVYLLRPPEHSQELLANAQVAWLGSARGRSAGWYSVSTPQQAQALANQGELVVASYQSPDPHRAGHIGIVRPDAVRTPEQIKESGVMITQAGERNYLRVSERAAFRGHRGAWPGDVQYFAHEVPPP